MADGEGNTQPFYHPIISQRRQERQKKIKTQHRVTHLFPVLLYCCIHNQPHKNIIHTYIIIWGFFFSHSQNSRSKHVMTTIGSGWETLERGDLGFGRAFVYRDERLMQVSIIAYASPREERHHQTKTLDLVCDQIPDKGSDSPVRLRCSVLCVHFLHAHFECLYSIGRA